MKAPGAGPSGGNLNALYMYDAGGNVGQLVAWTTGFGGAQGNAWHACRFVAPNSPPCEGGVGGGSEGTGAGPSPRPLPAGERCCGAHDPYGRIMTASGPYAAANPFRGSTKRFDPETGSPQRISPQAELSNFGLRYYSATLGRWINRDPIGDFATANLAEGGPSADSAEPTCTPTSATTRPTARTTWG